MSLSSLPILDLSQADDPQHADDFRRQLRDVTHSVGFFYLTGHGIPASDFSELLDTAQRFFALPEQDKLSIENTNSPHFRGYTRVGGERTLGNVDWREQIDIGPHREPVSQPLHAYDRLTGPNLYPDALPELKTVTDAWHEKLTAVGERLLSEWAHSLGQPADVFTPAFANDPESFIKIIRYPAPTVTPAEVAAEAAATNASKEGTAEESAITQGVGEHRDSGVLTLLYPQPGTTGLQVNYQDTWIDVEPIENTFVVNIGKLLEVATGGYLRATVHRVLLTPPGEDRISVPFFYNPSLRASLPELTLPEELASQARGVSADERDALYAVYGENALESRLRSHPNVAAIHHADLLETPARTHAS